MAVLLGYLIFFDRGSKEEERITEDLRRIEEKVQDFGKLLANWLVIEVMVVKSSVIARGRFSTVVH
jgi:hypothetical protein